MLHTFLLPVEQGQSFVQVTRKDNLRKVLIMLLSPLLGNPTKLADTCLWSLCNAENSLSSLMRSPLPKEFFYRGVKRNRRAFFRERLHPGCGNSVRDQVDTKSQKHRKL